MPTYQYRCPTCEHEFETFQSIVEDPISTCPSCDGETRRVISGGVGLIFKGSGFYLTDYRSDSYKKDASKDKESTISSSDKSTSKKTKTADNKKKKD
jgi:putative FmdB family regulatory protein